MIESQSPHSALEADIDGLLDAGDHTAAAGLIVRGLGPELLGYLHAVAGSADEADEAFSAYCERLLRGLPSFRRESSVRTWSYRIARNLLIDGQRARRGRVRGGLSDELAAIADHVRTQTATYRRTETKDRFAELRARLSQEDRTLLVLRVDRELPWKEVATIMLDDLEPDRAAVARLRKRFERLIARLRDELKPKG